MRGTGGKVLFYDNVNHVTLIILCENFSDFDKNPFLPNNTRVPVFEKENTNVSSKVTCR